jgi:hypothetical protein
VLSLIVGGGAYKAVHSAGAAPEPSSSYTTSSSSSPSNGYTDPFQSERCQSGSMASLPEPASLAVLVSGALLLIRRRCRGETP